MPITKFSLAALREHIRKYLWIYVIGIGLCLLGTNLLWTTTAPRTPMEQVVQIYLADDYSNGDALNSLIPEVLVRTQAEDESLLEVEILSMPFTENDYYSSMLLMTRLTTGDADAFLCGPAVMNYLIGTGAALPLDDYYADGFLADSGLEPYYVAVQETEDTEPHTILAGFRLDPVKALTRRGALSSEGAFLLVTSNGTNVDSTLRTLENLMDLLMEESADAGTESAEPAA